MVLASLVVVSQLRTVNVQNNYGIDVSSHNGKIKWSEVRKDGVSFALIRCGGRSYASAGRLYEDEEFKRNLRLAHRNGMNVGVYFYSQATTKEEAVEEAQMVLEHIRGKTLELPVFLDVEDTETGGKGRADGLTIEQRDEVVNAFCDTIRKKGYQAGVYSNRWYLTHKMNVASFHKNTEIWVAEYHDGETPKYDGKWDYWQYSMKGEVSGIDGPVDLDRYPSRRARTTTRTAESRETTGKVTDKNSKSAK